MGNKSSVSQVKNDDKRKTSKIFRSLRKKKREKDQRFNDVTNKENKGTADKKTADQMNRATKSADVAEVPKTGKQITFFPNKVSKPGSRYKVKDDNSVQEPRTIKLYDEKAGTSDGSVREYVIVDPETDGEEEIIPLPDSVIDPSAVVSDASISFKQIKEHVWDNQIQLPKGYLFSSMDILRPACTHGPDISFIVNAKQRPPKPAVQNRVIDKFRQWQVLSTWFLGPKAENQKDFLRLAAFAFSHHCSSRSKYARTDPVSITENVKDTEAFKKGIEKQKEVLMKIVRKLEQSVPSFSPRYQGHMLWDTAMPANLGYLVALLYNQNNVALEASPVTTVLEIEVGKQLCEMIFESHKHLPKEKDEFCIPDPKIKPWSHLVAGGSIANIEALWATRNVKFVPLAVQKVLLENQSLAAAKDLEVYIPRLKVRVKLVEADSWDLLNMDLDDVIMITSRVAELVGCKEEVCMDAIMKYSVTRLGLHGILRVFHLQHAPRVMAPATAHYSWKKAANILGLGIDNLIPIGVDESARMDTQELIDRLRECEHNKIPVLSVVPVIGTTEESAVDPLDKILEIRTRARDDGLNFVINADAAWGGYFMTMLHRTDNVMVNKDHDEYVPACSLSTHTITQLSKLHLADTVTIDPHKSGFIPYPAGGLCYRNGRMRQFIKMAAQVVSHDDDEDLAMGLCAVEGSKPGASAVAVYMAHETIGLNGDGYGRILSQCTFGAKLFYCLWLTLAKDEDDFVCIPMKDVPPFFKEKIENIKNTIHGCIFGPGMKAHEILEVEEVTKILRYCGPDTLINAFAVNIKGNEDIDLCNKLNKLVFAMLSHSDSEDRVYRVPLILTQSYVSPSNAYRVVEQFEKRLKLRVHPTKDLHFLINTVMNPWIGQPDLVANLGSIFRDTVLTAIGTVTDKPDTYKFVCVGRLGEKVGKKKEKNVFFAELLPSFTSKSHQYHVVVKFTIPNRAMAIKFRSDQSLCAPGNPLTLKTVQEKVLGEFLQMKDLIDLKYVATSKSGEETASDLQVRIMDVPRFQHFDKCRHEYYHSMRYFLYGDACGAHMSHVISHSPDFFQVVNLDFIGNPQSTEDRYVEGIDDDLLEEGLFVDIEGMSGQPVKNSDTDDIIDPLTEKTYFVKFTGLNGVEGKSEIKISNKYAKVWFDGKL